MGAEICSHFFIMKININNYSWDIIYTSEINNLKRSDGTITLGVTDINLMSIFIYSNLNNYMRSKVLIHELTHAYMFSYNYYIPIDQEEFICSFVENYAKDIISQCDYILNEYYASVRPLESSC